MSESYQPLPHDGSLAPGLKVSAVTALCSACQTQGLLMTASPPSSPSPGVLLSSNYVQPPRLLFTNHAETAGH